MTGLLILAVLVPVAFVGALLLFDRMADHTARLTRRKYIRRMLYLGGLYALPGVVQLVSVGSTGMFFVLIGVFWMGYSLYLRRAWRDTSTTPWATACCHDPSLPADGLGRQPGSLVCRVPRTAPGCGDPFRASRGRLGRRYRRRLVRRR